MRESDRPGAPELDASWEVIHRVPARTLDEAAEHRLRLAHWIDDEPRALSRVARLLHEEAGVAVESLARDELLGRAAALLAEDRLRWRDPPDAREIGDDDVSPLAGPAPPPVDPQPVVREHDYDLTLAAPSHIASGAEEITLRYAVSDPDAITTAITVEVLRASDDQPVHAFPGAPHDDGRHEITWDGRASGADFPSGYVDLRNSPYVVRATLRGPKGDRVARCELRVELVEFKAHTVLARTLRRPQDREVYAQIRYLPTSGRERLFLRSDLYATRSSEMEDDTAFTAYRDLHGDGPRLPVELVTKVRASTGAAVPAAKALGDARVLWDLTDAPRSRSTYLSTAAPAFVDGARRYDLAAGRPVDGDNAHVDRGGKRAAAGGGPAVLGAPDGEVSDFPYAVTAGATRWWAAFSEVVQSGEREGRSGVLFRPSRMAGDNYKLWAYLDLGRSLDTADATPSGAFRTLEVAELEVWRRFTLRAHWRKTRAITAPLPPVADYYADAFVDVDDQISAAQVFAKADYDAAFEAAKAAVDPAVVPALMSRYSLPEGSQYDQPRPPDSFGGSVERFFADLGRWVARLFGATLAPAPTTWVATFHPYAAFKQAAQRGQGWSDAQLAAALTNITAATEADYVERCTDFAMEIATAMCMAKTTASGVTILQFDWTHSLEEPADNGRLNGNAVFKQRDACGFALYNPRQDTTGHEIGHDLFLPHAPRRASDGTLLDAGGGITPDAHDGHDLHCLMSYARPRPGFCGLCLLRLAGWTRAAFDRRGPTVAK